MIADRYKAWIALLGSIVTALLGLDVIPAESWKVGLTIASAILTAILTYTVPNKPVVQSRG